MNVFMPLTRVAMMRGHVKMATDGVSVYHHISRRAVSASASAKTNAPGQDKTQRRKRQEHERAGEEDGTETVSLDTALPLSKMPGPKGLRRIPYLGTLFLFKPFTKYSLYNTSDMASDMHNKYGPVYKSRLGRNYAVTTCNTKDIERILRQEPMYPRRRLLDLSRVYRERSGLPQTLGSCHGEEWHALRKPLNVLLKRRSAGLGFLPALNGVADDFAQKLSEVNGEDLTSNAKEFYELSFRFATESFGVLCFNNRLGFLDSNFENSPEKVKLLAAFRTSIRSVFRAVIGLERRYLKTDKDKFYQSYREAMEYIHEHSIVHVKKAMEVRRRSPGQADEELSLTSCPHSHSQSHSQDQPHEETDLLTSLVRRNDLTMEQILAVIDSLLVGASDSTGKVLSVVLYDLARHPHIQERVAQEVLQNTGPDGGAITKDNVDNLRLLKACIKESMRIHYPVPTGLERTLPTDMVISGYRVPAGTSVLMAVFRSATNPEYFPDPFAFKPDGWLRKRTNASEQEAATETASASNSEDASRSAQHAFAFLPFGYGARSCIGSRVAEMKLTVGLAKIVQKLRVEVHPSYELKIQYTPFITPIDPIPFTFTKHSK